MLLTSYPYFAHLKAHQRATDLALEIQAFNLIAAFDV